MYTRAEPPDPKKLACVGTSDVVRLRIAKICVCVVLHRKARPCVFLTLDFELVCVIKIPLCRSP